MVYNDNRKNKYRNDKYIKKSGKTGFITWLVIAIAVIYTTFLQSHPGNVKPETVKPETVKTESVYEIPEYSGETYAVINGNVPFFTADDMTTEAFETYSDFDSLGRCGVAYANACRELMPRKKRGDISHIKPTGWVQRKYPGIVDSDPPYLYNRSHLIAYSLTAENDNERNLITGTRYMNYDGMRPFEEMVVEYIDETDNHVLYRVTPMFTGDNLLADGVLMEALSVEDGGKGICFCVYCYNVQPGIEIDYSTGENRKIK